MKSHVPRKSKETKTSNSTLQLDQIPPSYYKNDEDALEAGTELEEKAERFAIGWKAQKYYEKSLTLYTRAITLNKRNPDAPYNAARIYFILATTFLPPPKSIDALRESVSLYRQSLELLIPIESSDGSPSAFYLDVQFNLAVTLLALADQLELGKESIINRMTIVEEAVRLFGSVIEGQELVLQRQRIYEQEAAEDEAQADVEASGADEEMNIAHTSDAGQSRSEYTASLITPSAALETLYNLHLAALAALDIAQDEASIRELVTLSTSSSERARSVMTAFPDGEARSPDGEWSENVESFRYVHLDLKIAELSKRQSSGIDTEIGFEVSLALIVQESTQQAKAALISGEANMIDQTTTRGRAAHRIYLQQLEHLGDLLLTVSRLQLHRLHIDPQDQSLAQLIWTTLGLSSKLYLAVLKEFDTTADTVGTSAVLGQSNASTATTRRRCSLYTSLSTVSILRSNSLLLRLITTVDQKVCEQLVGNGRIYARNAITEIGLGWLLKTNGCTAARYEMPHGGLESLQGEAEAILTLLRSLYIRSTVLEPASNLQEAEIVCLNLKLGLLQGDCSTTWQWILFYSRGAGGGQCLLEQIIGEEGITCIPEEEKIFWTQVETKLLS